MKLLFALSTIMISSVAFSAAQPIRENVEIRSAKFSELLYQSLEAKVKPEISETHTGRTTTLNVDKLLSCKKRTFLGGRGPIATYKCTLIAPNWNEFGSESYGSGDKAAMTKKLYDSLSVKATNEAGLFFKNIDLEEVNPQGGTDRSLLNCVRPGKEAREMGFRDTCQLTNAL